MGYVLTVAGCVFGALVIAGLVFAVWSVGCFISEGKETGRWPVEIIWVPVVSMLIAAMSLPVVYLCFSRNTHFESNATKDIDVAIMESNVATTEIAIATLLRSSSLAR